MKRTWKGRVVYDRPKHLFSWSDLQRLAKNLGATVFLPSEEPKTVWANSAQIKKFLDDVFNIETETVSAHDFGGGGGSRPIGAPPPAPDTYGDLIGSNRILIVRNEGV